ncbi:hypothetical protein AMATHDRAFT_43846 [Amanita thiersii Skay4041]|uniref:Uncharacterized protein n=1 Tax=Amanita thiersii Skay4041 TaxID=703135 RepID=A0A2A9N9P4_9AGAR|nr:hypothetical protein AMATHDRAFT_43846 [Amanita thiersii Skay4041]
MNRWIVVSLMAYMKKGHECIVAELVAPVPEGATPVPIVYLKIHRTVKIDSGSKAATPVATSTAKLCGPVNDEVVRLENLDSERGNEPLVVANCAEKGLTLAMLANLAKAVNWFVYAIMDGLRNYEPEEGAFKNNLKTATWLCLVHFTYEDIEKAWKKEMVEFDNLVVQKLRNPNNELYKEGQEIIDALKTEVLDVRFQKAEADRKADDAKELERQAREEAPKAKEDMSRAKEGERQAKEREHRANERTAEAEERNHQLEQLVARLQR